MLVINPARLRRFRGKDRCELCCRQSPCIDGLDPHHWKKRGLGGGTRLDLSINLIAVCRIPCHNDCERGVIPEAYVLRKIAAREGTTPEAIVSVLDWVLALDKYSTDEAIKRSLRRLQGREARSLAARTLQEIRNGGEIDTDDQGSREGEGVHGVAAVPGQPHLRPGLSADGEGWVRA